MGEVDLAPFPAHSTDATSRRRAPTMKLSIEHTFAIAPADYANLYFDEPFSIELCAAVKLGRTLLRLDRDRRRALSATCAASRSATSPRRSRRSWRGGASTTSRSSTSISRSSAVVAGRAEPRSREGGRERHARLRGRRRRREAHRARQVNVSVFGLGGLVERFVVGEVEKSYDDASAFTKAFLERRQR